MKISPRLKNQSEAENESRTSEVEVPQAERTAEIGEPEQEDDAERKPDADRVDLPAAERAAVAAGHLPRDLRSRPRFGDGAGAVVHPAERDLSRGAPPDADLPVPALRVEGRVGHAVLLGVAVEPVGDLLVAEEDPCRALLRQVRARRDGSKRSLDEPPLRVVDRLGHGRRSVRGGREHRRGEQSKSDPPHEEDALSGV